MKILNTFEDQHVFANCWNHITSTFLYHIGNGMYEKMYKLNAVHIFFRFSNWRCEFNMHGMPRSQRSQCAPEVR